MGETAAKIPFSPLQLESNQGLTYNIYLFLTSIYNEACATRGVALVVVEQTEGFQTEGPLVVFCASQCGLRNSKHVPTRGETIQFGSALHRQQFR